MPPLSVEGFTRVETAIGLLLFFPSANRGRFIFKMSGCITSTTNMARICIFTQPLLSSLHSSPRKTPLKRQFPVLLTHSSVLQTIGQLSNVADLLGDTYCPHPGGRPCPKIA